MKVNLPVVVRQLTACMRNYHTSRSFQAEKRKNRGMPRNSEHVLNMLKMREKKMLKSMRYQHCNKISMHILGSGACGAPACLLVSTDQLNFMFNCGEGTQRLANEHRFKLTKVGNIFVTASTWKNLGGIPGLILTLQDNGVSQLSLHGPRGTYDLLQAVEKFVSLTTMEIIDETLKETQSHECHVMTVSYVPISRDSKELQTCVSELVDETDYYSRNSNGKRIGYVVEKEKKLRKVEKQITRISDVMCYICTTRAKSGALSLEKCVEFGLKPGPDFGLLKSGQDIVTEDGRLVRSKDVCFPDDPGIVFMVVDCPTEEYLDSFVNHSAFTEHQGTIEKGEMTPAYVFHFTPDAIIDNPRYQEWINKFPSTTEHIVLNEGNRCMGSEAVHKSQHQLHLLHPEIFPFLKEDSFGESKEFHAPRMHRAKTTQSLSLRPPTRFPETSGILLEPQTYTDDLFAMDGFRDVLAELQTKIETETKLLKDPSEYPRLVMLGTGSSIPNKVRNTSAILLRINESHSIILDCGEGTFGQIVRFYGTEYKNVLSTIRAIYVSHLHADHHLGLVCLLVERSKITKEPVYLLAPEQIEAWLQFYHNRFEPISDLYTLIPNQNICLNKRTLPPETTNEMNASLNVTEISTIYVKHCWYAFGVRITLPDSRKIVYSGDTMPCEGLVELGKNCDLLIHEATMEDDLLQEARLKCHSTTSQAIRTGELMNAEFVLLTHFSQRYSKLPQIPVAQNVGIAYDYMDIKLSHVSLLPLLYPTLRLMYNEYYMAMECRATKRQEKCVSNTMKLVI